MKTVILAAAAALALAAPALASGDATKGEREFNKCKSCHEVVAGDGTVIVRGGKAGPNLYGVIGRTAGSLEGFNFRPSIVAAGEKGLVWDAESFDAYSKDPTAFLKSYLGDNSASSSMSFKLRRGGDDIAAYLEQVSSASQ